jgi:conjugal transfer pilin signal peptidase TrbI
MAPGQSKQPRGGRHLRRQAGQLLAIVAALAVWHELDDAVRSHLILINRSTSLPQWAYLVKRGDIPTRGTVSFFVPRRGALIDAHFGVRPAPFGKIAYGLPGDRVERLGRRVSVIPAGSAVPVHVSMLKSVSSLGEPLAAGPVGIIPPGCYYLGSPHQDGLDSRYAAIGFVCTRQIIGTARMVIL